MHVDESASIADFYFQAIVFLPSAPNKEEVSHENQQQRVFRFDSRLEIPVAKELADFIFSISPSFKAALMEKGAFVEFTQYLNSKKNSRGFIPVTKDAGLFVCKVPKGKG